MGLFGGLGNILGKVTGVKVQPFKGKVKVGTPLQGINTGDLFTLASLAAPGGNIFSLLGKGGLGNLSTANLLGNSGLSKLFSGDLSKLGLNDMLGMLGGPAGVLGSLGSLGSSGSGGSGTGGSTGTGAALNQFSTLLNSIMPGAIDEAKALPQLSKDRRMLATQAASRLTPGAAQSSLDRSRAQLMNQARRDATQAQFALGDNATGLNTGIQLGAMNRATMQANQNEADVFNPANMAQMDAQRLSFLDPSLHTSSLSMGLGGLGDYMNMYNGLRSSNAAYNASKPPSFLEQLLGIAPTIYSYYEQSKKEKEEKKKKI